MKLLRFGPRGQEKPGLLDTNGVIRDLSSHVSDINGDALAPAELERLAAIPSDSLPKVSPDTRIGPCISGTGKFLCIGRNYSEHAKETGNEVPEEPVLFSKATSSISGPNDDVVIPLKSTKTDWEVELGVIIGSPAKRVSPEIALGSVAGYCIVNDVSERDYQLKGTGQWTKGKSCDSFGPIGPWLVTKEEIEDPQNLEMKLSVDGKVYQQSSTAMMIFDVAYLISYLSGFFTLYPGDIIATGTPPGVGLGQKPDPVFLKPGQVMQLEIAGLGVQLQRTVAEEACIATHF